MSMEQCGKLDGDLPERKSKFVKKFRLKLEIESMSLKDGRNPKKERTKPPYQKGK